MIKKIILVIVILNLPLLTFSAPPEEQEKPNILWLVLEDTSPYQFGCYGGKDAKTPEIDRLASKSIRFTNASSTAPHCSPARC